MFCPRSVCATERPAHNPPPPLRPQSGRIGRQRRHGLGEQGRPGADPSSPDRLGPSQDTDGIEAMNPAETMQQGCLEVGPRRPGPPAASFFSRVEALALTGFLIVITLGVGWIAWSIIEWRHGRTASYRLTGLRVVRRSDAKPIGLGLSVLRNGVCATLLIIPTIIVCAFVAFAFVMGASPPSDLLRKPRNAPWDLLTKTMVVDERRASHSGSQMRLVRWHQQVPLSVN